MRASTERERDRERERKNGSLKRAATAAEAEAVAEAAATPTAAADGAGSSARQNAFANLAELRALEQERAALLAEFAASQQRLEQQHRGVLFQLGISINASLCPLNFSNTSSI